jgi:hypothetical protein
MADNQLAGTGHRAQFWLDNDTNVLTRINHVTSIGLPSAERDEVDVTHLDSDAREYAPGLSDFGEFEIALNLRPGSDTDLLLEEAVEAGDERDFKVVLPIRGTLVREYTGTCFVKAYDRGDVTVDDKMEATLTCRATGAVTSGAPA